MRYPRMVLDAQAALEFLVGQATHIEAEVLRTPRPDIQYANLIPVDTSAMEWAKSITFYSVEQTGQADWYNHLADDMPLADVTKAKHEHTVDMGAIGYMYTLEELGFAQMIPGTQLTPERAESAVRAAEEMNERVALRGDVRKNWTGLFNDPNVIASLATADGANGSMAWANKTEDKIRRDINGVLTGIHTESLTVEMADTVLLPIVAMQQIAELQMPNTNMTVLQWILLYNIYTMQRRQPLTILGVRGLESAGAGGTGRMIAYRRDPSVLKFHMPMPHRFLPAFQQGALKFIVPGIMRMGGTEIRRPMAVRYLDGITDAVAT